MTNMTPTRLGQVNKAGDAKAKFLQVFSGEVLTAYDETNVTDALHYTRTIDHGKSATFPVTWKVDSGYHSPGAKLLGSQSMNKNEMIINVDDLLISDVFIPNIDEAMSHVDYSQIYSKEIGNALARAKDKRVIQTAILCARSAAFVSGKPGGSTIVEAQAKVDGLKLATAISLGAVKLDEKDVPQGDRSVLLKAAQTHLLARTPGVISRDLGGNGSIVTGYIGEIDGIMVVKTNNIPQANVAAVAGENNTYGGDFTNSVGVIIHRSAVGTVKLMDLSVEMTGHDWAVAFQGTLIVGKYLQGHGILRPEAAVEIAIA